MSKPKLPRPERAMTEAEAEILKLARLLQLEPERLGYLEALSLKDLHALREQVTEVVFSAHDGVFRRLAAASKLLPAGLVASLSEQTFGPMLSARIAGVLEPDRAGEVGAKLSTEFVADLAIELDPRRASAVIARIPPEQIFEITSELARRGEYVTMGRFVGHLNDGGLDAALRALDDEALLRTMFVTEDRLTTDQLAQRLGEERMSRLRAAAAEQGVELEQLTAEARTPTPPG